jgi:hypothetical protein
MSCFVQWFRSLLVIRHLWPLPECRPTAAVVNESSTVSVESPEPRTILIPGEFALDVCKLFDAAECSKSKTAKYLLWKKIHAAVPECIDRPAKLVFSDMVRPSIEIYESSELLNRSI